MFLPGRLPGRLGPVEAVLEGGIWVPGVETPEVVVAAGQGDGYVLEARSPAGAWFGTLKTWGGKLSHELNRWGTLTFSMSSVDPAAAEIRLGCEVWCWRGAAMCGRYSVIRAESEAGADRVLNVTAADALWRLHREAVPLFTARQLVGVNSYGPQRVDAVLANLLAQQVQEPVISLGVVAPSIAAVTVNLRLMGKSIFEWLQEIQKIAGGYYEVTPEGRLNWRASPAALRGAQSGTWLRDGKNLLGLRHEVDFSEYANRVVAVGAGGWYENSLVVTVNDEAAQAAHGSVVRAVVMDRGIKDLGTLGLWAARELAERARPRVALDVEAIDLGGLAAAGVVGLSHAPGAFTVGSSVVVWHEDPEVSAELWVIKQSVSLEEPAAVEVELGDPGESDAAKQKSGGWQGLLDAVASLARQGKTLAGEVDGELEEEVAAIRGDLAELSAGVAEMIGDGVPEAWAAEVLEEMLQDPPAGVILDALMPLLQHAMDNLYSPSGFPGETLPGVLQDLDERLDALEGAAPEFGDEMKPVTALEVVAGVSEKFAREDHEHQGVPIQTGETVPETVPETPCLCFKLDSEGRPLEMYAAMYENSEMVWALQSHLEAEEEEE